MQKMIQLEIRSRSLTKNQTPTPSVVRNLTPTPPKNLRLLTTPTSQPWWKLTPKKIIYRYHRCRRRFCAIHK